MTWVVWLKGKSVQLEFIMCMTYMRGHPSAMMIIDLNPSSQASSILLNSAMRAASRLLYVARQIRRPCILISCMRSILDICPYAVFLFCLGIVFVPLSILFTASHGFRRSSSRFRWLPTSVGASPLSHLSNVNTRKQKTILYGLSNNS